MNLKTKLTETMSSTPPLAVQICDINAANLKQLRVLNVSTLPVRYTDKFYKDLLTNGFAEYLKFASWNGFAVAAVCARIERHETVPDSFKLYIMTINVLAAYRRRGIGNKLSLFSMRRRHNVQVVMTTRRAVLNLFY